MRENGLNPDKYYSPDKGSYNSGSGSGNEGCYLTSACVAARGLPDDCEELQTLRSFRDGYLSKQAGGKAEIEQYYKTAPDIVSAVNQDPDAAVVWSSVYEELIKPCVELIHSSRNEDAHRLYKSYALKLTEQYL